MSQRSKPTALKLLNGNPGKQALNRDEPKPREGIPTMPNWLKPFKIAMAEWKRETAELDYMGVITQADLGVLANRCYAADRIQTLAMELKIEGSTITTTKYKKDGKETVEYTSIVANPKANQILALMVEYRQYGTLLGLDPSSRSKLHTTKKPEKDKFEDF